MSSKNHQLPTSIYRERPDHSTTRIQTYTISTRSLMISIEIQGQQKSNTVDPCKHDEHNSGEAHIWYVGPSCWIQESHRFQWSSMKVIWGKQVKHWKSCKHVYLMTQTLAKLILMKVHLGEYKHAIDSLEIRGQQRSNTDKIVNNIWRMHIFCMHPIFVWWVCTYMYKNSLRFQLSLLFHGCVSMAAVNK